MSKALKKHVVKFPVFVTIFYSKNKKIITLFQNCVKKSVNLPVQLFIIKSKNILKISKLPFFSVSEHKKKKLEALRGVVGSLIRKFVIEMSFVLYQKLKIVGVGFRASNLINFKKEFLLLKIGYSHFLYFKLPKNLTVFCLKTTKLFVFGSCYLNTTKIAALIRSYKIPECYKGKGIFRNSETIFLKQGKKI